jgi:hypothetical protein
MTNFLEKMEPGDYLEIKKSDFNIRYDHDNIFIARD